MATHYEVLGISQDATEKEIKTAFRALARKHHPDKGGDPEEFKRINEAHEVLSNSDDRQEYDKKLLMEASTSQSANPESEGLFTPDEASPEPASPESEASPEPASRESEASPEPASPESEASPEPASPESEASHEPASPESEASHEPASPVSEDLPAYLRPEFIGSPVTSDLREPISVRSSSRNSNKSSRLNQMASGFYNGGKSLFDYMLPKARALDDKEDQSKLVTQLNLLLTRGALMVAMKTVSFVARAVPQLYTQGKQVYRQMTEARDNPNASLQTKSEAYDAGQDFVKKVEQAEKESNLKLGNDPLVDRTIARDTTYKADKEYNSNIAEIRERLSSAHITTLVNKGRTFEYGFPSSMVEKKQSINDEQDKLRNDAAELWATLEKTSTEEDWDRVRKETENIERGYAALDKKIEAFVEEARLSKQKHEEQQIIVQPAPQSQSAPEKAVVAAGQDKIVKDKGLQDVKLSPMPDTTNSQAAIAKTAEVSSRLEARQLERNKVENNKHPLAIEQDNTTPTPFAPT